MVERVNFRLRPRASLTENETVHLDRSELRLRPNSYAKLANQRELAAANREIPIIFITGHGLLSISEVASTVLMYADNGRLDHLH